MNSREGHEGEKLQIVCGGTSFVFEIRLKTKPAGRRVGLRNWGKASSALHDLSFSQTGAQVCAPAIELDGSRHH